ncbi:MAG: hypothetical protein IJ222_05345 [Bacteroidales bacterium]|nr:hypothetical protein [Bacteroidales bacterium]
MSGVQASTLTSTTPRIEALGYSADAGGTVERREDVAGRKAWENGETGAVCDRQRGFWAAAYAAEQICDD